MYDGMKGSKISMSEIIHEITRSSAVSGCLFICICGPGLLWDARPHCKMHSRELRIKLHNHRIDQKQPDGKLGGPALIKISTNLTILCCKCQTVNLPVEI